MPSELAARAFMPAGAKDSLTCREICRDIPTTARADGPLVGLSIGRTLQADGAPLMISKDSLKFISDSQLTVAHADRGIFAVRKEGYLRRPAEAPLR